jgi:hypothetical protein
MTTPVQSEQVVQTIQSIQSIQSKTKDWIAQHSAFVLLISALIMHYISVHYYAYYCTRWGVWGFISSLWRIETVQCRATKWVFTYSYDYLHNLWVFIGGVCVARVFQWFQTKQQ